MKKSYYFENGAVFNAKTGEKIDTEKLEELLEEEVEE